MTVSHINYYIVKFFSEHIRNKLQFLEHQHCKELDGRITEIEKKSSQFYKSRAFSRKYERKIQAQRKM